MKLEIPNDLLPTLTGALEIACRDKALDISIQRAAHVLLYLIDVQLADAVVAEEGAS